LTTTGKT